MKCLIAVVAILFGSVAYAVDVHVKGYTRSDGTYVAPHTRSAPNAYQWDNKNYEPSQPAYNSSYFQPSTTRYQDSNPYNDSPPAYEAPSFPKLPTLGDAYNNYR